MTDKQPDLTPIKRTPKAPKGAAMPRNEELMTLSEAIHRAEETARDYDKKALACLEHYQPMGPKQAELYMQYAKEQRQIKEWLKELQVYRWSSHMDAD